MKIARTRNLVLLAMSLTMIAVLIFVIWPVYLVFQAAWSGRDYAEPGLTISAQHVSLALQTGKLILLVLAIALPVGVTVALIIFRTNVPARLVWQVLILLPALLPLDLHATAWLAAIGPQGLAKSIGLPIELKGLIGAAWVHAMASIAWIVIFVAPAIRNVEAELEEDCLLIAGPMRTMWYVTLRRSLGGIVAAALIVSVQTAGEMAITDLLQVRTYAETIYTEFALASRIGAATATAVPGIFVWCVLVGVAGALLIRTVPQDAQALFARRPRFRLPTGRWIAFGGCLFVTAATLGIPAVSLVWRAGLKFPRLISRPPSSNPDPSISGSTSTSHAPPPYWSAVTFRENITRSAESAGEQLELSFKVAGATAALVVPLAWLLISLAQKNTIGQWTVGGITCVLFALPGPVVGIGLKLATGQVYRWLGSDPSSLGGRLANWFGEIDWWNELPPAVLVWLHALRALPFALAVLWPVRRLVHRRLLEAAAMDGAGAWGQFRFVEFPACRAAVLAAALVTAVISIGELSGSVIVTPPGQQPLSVRIFTLAHHGLESHLAGICLVLLGVTTIGSLGVFACVRWNMRTLRD
jgi:iron(III) transport system permease protein